MVRSQHFRLRFTLWKILIEADQLDILHVSKAISNETCRIVSANGIWRIWFRPDQALPTSTTWPEQHMLDNMQNVDFVFLSPLKPLYEIESKVLERLKRLISQCTRGKVCRGCFKFGTCFINSLPALKAVHSFAYLEKVALEVAFPSHVATHKGLPKSGKGTETLLCTLAQGASPGLYS